jgi:hypothetical protein
MTAGKESLAAGKVEYKDKAFFSYIVAYDIQKAP